MQQHESVWPTICGMFNVPAEQEQAFTRDLDLSLADATYFIETHEAKQMRRAELYDRRHALEQALAAVDAVMPAYTARLADYASRGLHVAGAAHMLARHRLAVADRLAACNSEFLAVADAANADWKLASQALKARCEMSAYWEGAWRRYKLEFLLERNPHVSPEFTARMYDKVRIACLGNTHERLGFERTALPSYTGLDRDARRRHMAAHIAGTAEQSTGR